MSYCEYDSPDDSGFIPVDELLKQNKLLKDATREATFLRGNPFRDDLGNALSGFEEEAMIWEVNHIQDLVDARHCMNCNRSMSPWKSEIITNNGPEYVTSTICQECDAKAIQMFEEYKTGKIDK